MEDFRSRSFALLRLPAELLGLSKQGLQPVRVSGGAPERIHPLPVVLHPPKVIASVHGDRLPGEPGRVLAAQEGDGAGDVRGETAGLAQRSPREELTAHALQEPRVLHQGREDAPWRHHVHPDAMAPELQRGDLREVREPPLEAQ